MRMAIVRFAVMFILMVNQILITYGWSPLPFEEEEIYEFVNATAMVIVGVWAWWKNNNITKNAKKAQEFKDKLDEK